MKIAIAAPPAEFPARYPMPDWGHAILRIERYLKKRGHRLARFDTCKSQDLSFPEFAKVEDVDCCLCFGGGSSLETMLSHSGPWGLFIGVEDLAQFDDPLAAVSWVSALRRASKLIADDWRALSILETRLPMISSRLRMIDKSVAPIAPELRGSPQALDLPADAIWALLLTPHCPEADAIRWTFSQWHRRDSRVFLLSVGGETGENLKSSVAKRLNQAGVIDLPPLHPSRFAYAANNARVVIDASDTPQLSPLVLQAMHQRSLIAVSAKRSASDLIAGENCIEFSTPTDLIATCQAISDHEREALGRRSQLTAQKSGDEELEAALYERLIEEMAAKSPSTGLNLR